MLAESDPPSILYKKPQKVRVMEQNQLPCPKFTDTLSDVDDDEID